MKITKKTFLLFTLLFSFSSASLVANESLDKIARLSSIVIGISLGDSFNGFKGAYNKTRLTSIIMGVGLCSLGISIFIEKDQEKQYKRYLTSCINIGQSAMMKIFINCILGGYK